MSALARLHRPGQLPSVTYQAKLALGDAADYRLFQLKTVHGDTSETFAFIDRYEMGLTEQAVTCLIELGLIGEISRWERINEWQYRRRLDLSEAGLDLWLEIEAES